MSKIKLISRQLKDQSTLAQSIMHRSTSRSKIPGLQTNELIRRYQVGGDAFGVLQLRSIFKS